MRGPRAASRRISGTWPRRRALLLAALVVLLALGGPALAASGHPPGGEGEGAHLGERLPLWSALPFAGILLSIALFPLFRPHFWHDHYPKVSFAWAVLVNFLFLAGILGAVLLSGVWRPGEADVLGVEVPYQNAVRDAFLLAMGLLSLRFTPKRIRERNEFGWAPMKEVAYLFAGIFMTIIPALAILRAGSAGALASLVGGVESPARFFWVTGGLSSFLDNAPTYLSFFNTALGRFYPGVPEPEAVRGLIAEHPHILEAISAGAVFMGANTYIGNAPNFMVRSIAEEAGVEMPSFFGYILKYTLPFLVPCFLVVAWLFFG